MFMFVGCCKNLQMEKYIYHLGAIKEKYSEISRFERKTLTPLSYLSFCGTSGSVL